MKQNEFPPGWDEERVQSVIDYYENQTEDEAVAEAESAFRNEFITKVEVPTQLVPAVHELIARHKVQSRRQDDKAFHISKGRFVFGLPRSTEWASVGYLAPEIEATVHGRARIIVKPTIKFTLSNVARLGNLASKVGFVFSRVPKYFRALL